MQRQMDSYKSRLEALRPKYHAALAERRQTAIEFLSTDSASVDVGSLRGEAHKTAGTAGSFGYDKLSKAAERLCRALDEAEQSIKADSARATCEAYLASIEAVLSA